jgi:hypothetical protein
MAIVQGADYAAIQYTGKRLMMRLGVKLGDIFIAIDKAADPQTFIIRGPATEANAVG